MVPLYNTRGRKVSTLDSKTLVQFEMLGLVKQGTKTNDTDYDVVAEAEAILRDADALVAA